MTSSSADESIPEVAIVMPAYRCADTIVADVLRLRRALECVAPSHEIVVVVDGSSDGTREAISNAQLDHLTVWHYEHNEGKGFAVITGLLRTRARYIGFMDTGSDIDVTVWPRMIEKMRSGSVDVVVASKTHPESQVHYPWARHVYSWGFRTLTKALFRLGLRDTQTGAKLFRAEVVDDVAPCLLVKRFAFDIEFLALARHRGYRRMIEVPVHIRYDFQSSISVRAVFRMLWDTTAVWYRMYLRRYYDRLDSPVERARWLAQSPAVRG